MDFEFSPEQEELRRRAFEAGLEWKEEAAAWDADDEAPYQRIATRIGELGFFGLTMPEEYGGQGRSALDYVITVENLFRASQSWIPSEAVFETSGPGPTMVLMAENEVTRKKYLPAIVRGEMGCAIALTEPDHGSDLTHLEATATLRGGEYVLNGAKRFITGAIRSPLYAVFVRMNDEPGARGIGAILVEKGTPGFTLAKGATFVGSRGVPHGELYFENCSVPEENVIIGPGQFARLMGAFNMERLHNSSYSLGFAQAAFDETVAYATKRKSFGREIIEFQATYHTLVDMWMEIEALRLLTYRAAVTALEGRYPQALPVTLSKLYGSTILSELTLKGIQIHGGDGVTMDYPIQRIHREAIAALVAGGAPPVLKNTLAGLLFPQHRFPQTRPKA